MADHQQQTVATAPEEHRKVGVGALIVTAFALALSVATWQSMGGSSIDSSAESLARVAAPDIPGAITTMAGSPDFLIQFQGEAKTCPAPLAWVSIARLPGTQGGELRIQSGSYLSPTFELNDVPRRIAIPYPAPYELGRGEISVTGMARGVVISLSPAWTVGNLNGTNGTATKPVVWHIDKRCER